MTQNLIVYWQRLRQRSTDDREHLDAPVLELAACFGNPLIAAHEAAQGEIRHLDAGRGRPAR